jgi:hypothetical protein
MLRRDWSTLIDNCRECTSWPARAKRWLGLFFLFRATRRVVLVEEVVQGGDCFQAGRGLCSLCPKLAHREPVMGSLNALLIGHAIARDLNRSEPWHQSAIGPVNFNFTCETVTMPPPSTLQTIRNQRLEFDSGSTTYRLGFCRALFVDQVFDSAIPLHELQ